MLLNYIKHFTTGDVDLHKKANEFWILDKGPIIETTLGFIEVYGDPIKTRAEFEGYVAIVDK